ncbi:unnamed protein product [Triticum turgidum subsp. durum]|uniref:Uncharacterized protein n=2 Tax=Triticum TaxID=4564 RepID=A0A9R0ZIT1_TRITD|nr:unnamed protein product [Triticum turgidum subsp. durum]
MPKRGVEAFHIRTQAASLPSCYKHTGPSVFKLKRQEDLIINMDKKGGTSSSVELHNGWLKLWIAKVPRKVKIHLWCIYFQRIYVGDELKRRKYIDMVMNYRKRIVEFTKHNGTPNFGKSPEEYFKQRCVEIFT